MRIIVWLAILFCVACVALFALQRAKKVEMENDLSLSFPLEESFRSIFYYASLAPSSHNAQPWVIYQHSGPNNFTLALDSSRSLHRVDPENRELYLSLGTFLENVKQASRVFGFSAEVEFFSLPTLKKEVARIHFVARNDDTKTDNTARLALLTKRHTDKRRYDEEAINPAIIALLLEKHQPYLSYYAKGTSDFIKLADTAVMAMQVQAADQSKRDELSFWLRFSNDEAKSARDGMPAEQLGIAGIRKFFYYLLYNRDKARGEAFALEAVKQTTMQVTHCSGFFVVTGDDSLPELLQAGMNLEAFWLDATRRGIALQPLSQILEEEPFRQNFRKEYGTFLPPQMLFRAGTITPYGQNHKIRRNIADFIHQEL